MIINDGYYYITILYYVIYRVKLDTTKLTQAKTNSADQQKRRDTLSCKIQSHQQQFQSSQHELHELQQKLIKYTQMKQQKQQVKLIQQQQDEIHGIGRSIANQLKSAESFVASISKSCNDTIDYERSRISQLRCQQSDQMEQYTDAIAQCYAYINKNGDTLPLQLASNVKKQAWYKTLPQQLIDRVCYRMVQCNVMCRADYDTCIY